MPLALVVYVQTARTDWLEAFGPMAFLPAVAISGVLWYGLAQLHYFQKQERIWHHAIDRAQIFATFNIGLSPFLSWWHRIPMLPFYAACVGRLALSSLLLLVQVSRAVLRLVAML